MTARLARLGPVGRSVALVLLSVLLVSAVLALSGFSVATVANGMWQGAVAAPGAWQMSFRWGTPLFLIAIGAAIALRAGFFNIGGLGQFYVGATAALFVGLGLPGLPAIVVVPLGCLAAMAAGAAFAFIPGWLRVRFGTDEVITTLMSNFIGTLWLQYVTAVLLKDPSGTGQQTATRPVEEAYRIANVQGFSPATVAVVIGAGIVVWLLLERTPFGITSAIAGRNPVMARWQGLRLERVGLIAFLLSGALAGLAGAIEVFGPQGRLVSGFSPQLGFTAVLVAIVGGLNVAGIALAAAFFGGLQAALLYLPIVTPLPPSALDLLRGTIALLITVTSLGALGRAIRDRRTRAP